MSEENVQVCKRAFPVFERLDVEAGLEYLDPEIVFQSAIVSGAEGGSYRGHDGLRRWAAQARDAFAELRTVADEWRDLGSDQVLMLGRVYARGRESGADLESKVAFLCTLRDAKLAHVTGFLSHAEALEAAGLPTPAE
jgi:ketosteroid isomerase-like protein